MNPRVLNTFALLSCLSFLIGNIVFDLTDTPTAPADYRIFYIPLSIMIFSLILLANENSSGITRILWWFFMWLSIGQIVKFVVFDPFIQVVSDYSFLTIAVFGLFVKLFIFKNKDTNANG